MKGVNRMKHSSVAKFAEEYRKVHEENYYYRFLEEHIVALCKKYPKHTNQDKVYAKIALVNRAYKVNIEKRKVGAELRLAECLIADSKIDDMIRRLRSVREFNESTFYTIVEKHGEFVHLCKKPLGIRANSFCSKYLHFHLPSIIPIFDQFAYDEVWKLVGKEVKTNSEFDNYINEDYVYYCKALLHLIKKLKKDHGIVQPDLKTLDYLLYDRSRRGR